MSSNKPRSARLQIIDPNTGSEVILGSSGASPEERGGSTFASASAPEPTSGGSGSATPAAQNATPQDIAPSTVSDSEQPHEGEPSAKPQVQSGVSAPQSPPPSSTFLTGDLPPINQVDESVVAALPATTSTLQPTASPFIPSSQQQSSSTPGQQPHIHTMVGPPPMPWGTMPYPGAIPPPIPPMPPPPFGFPPGSGPTPFGGAIPPPYGAPFPPFPRSGVPVPGPTPSDFQGSQMRVGRGKPAKPPPMGRGAGAGAAYPILPGVNFDASMMEGGIMVDPSLVCDPQMGSPGFETGYPENNRPLSPAETVLKSYVIKALEDQVVNPHQGSLSSDHVENLTKAQHPDEFREVFGDNQSRRQGLWLSFLKRIRGEDIVVFSRQNKNTLQKLWYLRSGKCKDWEKADRKRDEQLQRNDRDHLRILIDHLRGQPNNKCILDTICTTKIPQGALDRGYTNIAADQAAMAAADGGLKDEDGKVGGKGEKSEKSSPPKYISIFTNKAVRPGDFVRWARQQKQILCERNSNGEWVVMLNPNCAHGPSFHFYSTTQIHEPRGAWASSNAKPAAMAVTVGSQPLQAPPPPPDPAILEASATIAASVVAEPPSSLAPVAIVSLTATTAASVATPIVDDVAVVTAAVATNASASLDAIPAATLPVSDPTPTSAAASLETTQPNASPATTVNIATPPTSEVAILKPAPGATAVGSALVKPSFQPTPAQPFVTKQLLPIPGTFPRYPPGSDPAARGPAPAAVSIAAGPGAARPQAPSTGPAALSAFNPTVQQLQTSEDILKKLRSQRTNVEFQLRRMETEASLARRRRGDIEKRLAEAENEVKTREDMCENIRNRRLKIDEDLTLAERRTEEARGIWLLWVDECNNNLQKGLPVPPVPTVSFVTAPEAPKAPEGAKPASAQPTSGLTTTGAAAAAARSNVTFASGPPAFTMKPSLGGDAWKGASATNTTPTVSIVNKGGPLLPKLFGEGGLSPTSDPKTQASAFDEKEGSDDDGGQWKMGATDFAGHFGGGSAPRQGTIGAIGGASTGSIIPESIEDKALEFNQMMFQGLQPGKHAGTFLAQECQEWGSYDFTSELAKGISEEDTIYQDIIDDTSINQDDYAEGDESAPPPAFGAKVKMSAWATLPGKDTFTTTTTTAASVRSESSSAAPK